MLVFKRQNKATVSLENIDHEKGGIMDGCEMGIAANYVSVSSIFFCWIEGDGEGARVEGAGVGASIDLFCHIHEPVYHMLLCLYVEKSCFLNRRARWAILRRYWSRMEVNSLCSLKKYSGPVYFNCSFTTMCWCSWSTLWKTWCLFRSTRLQQCGSSGVH